MTAIEAIPVRTMTHGTVPEGARELAVAKVRSVLRHFTWQVLSARVTLTIGLGALPPAAVAHLGVGPRVREGRTRVPRRPAKDCEPSLCQHQHMAGL
jgi:hypothetical protein